MSMPYPLSELKAQIVQNLTDIGIPEFETGQLEMASNQGLGGSGSKADIYWKKLDNGQLVAIKRLSTHLETAVAGGDAQYDEERRKRVLQYFERECILWHRGSQVSDDHQSSNIVRLLGFAKSFRDSLLPCLVMELYNEGDLRSLVSNNKVLSEKERLALLIDAASGLAYLHEPHLMIVHRDIKGSNIMVRRLHDGTLFAALGDFGSAKLLDPQALPILNSSLSASEAWTPPEYIVDGRLSCPTPTIYGDVWSFGCTVLEIMSNSNPWSGYRNMTNRLSGVKDLPFPPRPSCIKKDSSYWDLAMSCFQPIPTDRPTGRVLEDKLKHIYNNL